MSAPCSICLRGRSRFAFLVGAALLSALWTAACGPKYEDVFGSGLNPILSAPIENGWVVVDSTDGNVRAVLQLETEAAQGSLPWDLAEMALLFASDTIPPARMRCEESAVCRRVRRPVQSPNEQAVAEPPDRREEEVVICDHVVRAEFVLPAVPTAADSMVLRLGGTTIPLRWRE